MLIVRARFVSMGSSLEEASRDLGVSKPTITRHLKMLEEAKKRDHRKLGRELDLFSFPDEIGSGLAVFHPKGGVIRKELEDYARRRHEEAGYEFVNTPHITKAQLFHTSGHLDFYDDDGDHEGDSAVIQADEYVEVGFTRGLAGLPQEAQESLGQQVAGVAQPPIDRGLVHDEAEPSTASSDAPASRSASSASGP